MSSNQFLERFKGKTQVIGKEGVHGALGGKELIPKDTARHQSTGNAVKGQSKTNTPAEHLPKKVENPFLVANPFYLDEEERIKEERMREQKIKEERAREKEEKQREKQREKKSKEQYKTTMKSSKSMEKRTSGKEWVKLGGLGANIGGDQWLQKKNKFDKMQEFAEQVKVINSQKVVVPRPPRPTQAKMNPRQKALQYSKNVPKPTLIREVQPQPQVMVEQKQQLSELQAYALKHEQLRNMLKYQM